MKAILISILISMWLVSTIIFSYWYTQDYEIDKCKAISSNDYYYTKQNCWTVLERPIYEFIQGFLIFGLLLAMPTGLLILFVAEY